MNKINSNCPIATCLRNLTIYQAKEEVYKKRAAKHNEKVNDYNELVSLHAGPHKGCEECHRLNELRTSISKALETLGEELKRLEAEFKGIDEASNNLDYVMEEIAEICPYGHMREIEQCQACAEGTSSMFVSFGLVATGTA
jgi:chromosome segregation ATPase